MKVGIAYTLPKCAVKPLTEVILGRMAKTVATYGPIHCRRFYDEQTWCLCLSSSSRTEIARFWDVVDVKIDRLVFLVK